MGHLPLALIACLTVAACSGPIKDPVLAIDCADGQVGRLGDLPSAQRAEEISRGIEAMDTSWGTPSVAVLRCPDAADVEITVSVRQPEEAELTYYLPPAEVSFGSFYACADVASGVGAITIEGLEVVGARPEISQVPLAVGIKAAPSVTLVEGVARLPLGGAWEELGVTAGIDNTGNLYGSVYESYSWESRVSTRGAAPPCTILEFRSPP